MKPSTKRGFQLPQPNPLTYEQEVEVKPRLVWLGLNEELKSSPTRSQQRPIYQHDFEIAVEHNNRMSYQPAHTLAQLTSKVQQMLRTPSRVVMQQDYEVFGDFEGSNVQEVYYCKYDVVKIVLRGDTNSLGYCKWFQLGIRILNPKKELRITVQLLNLRQPEESSIYCIRRSDQTRSWVATTPAQTKYVRRVVESLSIPQYRKPTQQNIPFQSELRKTSQEHLEMPKKQVIKQVKCYYNQTSFTYIHRSKEQEELLYFSYSIPYTYTNLKQYLNKLSHQDCNVTTICSSQLDLPIFGVEIHRPLISDKKRVIIISRSRPCESETSHAVQDLMEHLLNNTLARQLMLFNIVPMLNPDGVVIGNSRCNVSGKDLTQQYQQPNGLCPENVGVMNYCEDAWLVLELRVDYQMQGYVQSNNKQFVQLLNQHGQHLQLRQYTAQKYDIHNLCDNYAKIFLPRCNNTNNNDQFAQQLTSALIDLAVISAHNSMIINTNDIQNNKIKYLTNRSEKKKNELTMLQFLKNNNIKQPEVQQYENNNITFASITDHEDDMLNTTQQIKEHPDHMLSGELGCSYILDQARSNRRGRNHINTNSKEDEYVNQLKNIEWKDTHRSTIQDKSTRWEPGALNKPMLISPNKKAQTKRYLSQSETGGINNNKQSSVSKHRSSQTQTQTQTQSNSQDRQFSENKYRMSTGNNSISQPKILIKSPFLPTKQELMNAYTLKKQVYFTRPASTLTLTNSKSSIIIVYPRMKQQQ